MQQVRVRRRRPQRPREDEQYEAAPDVRTDLTPAADEAAALIERIDALLGS